jgi:hypothetical protein
MLGISQFQFHGSMLGIVQSDRRTSRGRWWCRSLLSPQFVLSKGRRNLEYMNEYLTLTKLYLKLF